MNRYQSLATLALAGLLAVACQGATDEGANNAASAAPPVVVDAAAAAPADNAAAAATAPAASATPAGEATPAEPQRVTADQLAEVFAGTEVFLLDVRRPDELEELGTVEGYTNIPIDELAGRLDELPRDRPILTA